MDLNEMLGMDSLPETISEFEIVEPGNYAATVEAVIEGQAATRYLRVDFQLIKPDGTTQKMAKFYNCWHTKLNIAQRNIVELRNVYKMLGGDIKDSDSIIGKECYVKVDYKAYGKNAGIDTEISEISVGKNIDEDTIPF
jgi:hypothetical protein